MDGYNVSYKLQHKTTLFLYFFYSHYSNTTLPDYLLNIGPIKSARHELVNLGWNSDGSERNIFIWHRASSVQKHAMTLVMVADLLHEKSFTLFFSSGHQVYTGILCFQELATVLHCESNADKRWRVSGFYIFYGITFYVFDYNQLPVI